MARWTKCWDCGFMLDNYLESADYDWDNHDCVEIEEEEE